MNTAGVFVDMMGGLLEMGYCLITSHTLSKELWTLLNAESNLKKNFMSNVFYLTMHRI
jgi:hypothetical protein